jgi:hypothetical protein
MDTVKQTDKTGYQVNEFEFNCSSREVRILLAARYNTQDDLQGSSMSEPQIWRAIIPESIGETLWNGVCSAYIGEANP